MACGGCHPATFRQELRMESPGGPIPALPCSARDPWARVSSLPNSAHPQSVSPLQARIGGPYLRDAPLERPHLYPGQGGFCTFAPLLLLPLGPGLPGHRPHRRDRLMSKWTESKEENRGAMASTLPCHCHPLCTGLGKSYGYAVTCWQSLTGFYVRPSLGTAKIVYLKIRISKHP